MITNQRGPSLELTRYGHRVSLLLAAQEVLDPGPAPIRDQTKAALAQPA